MPNGFSYKISVFIPKTVQIGILGRTHERLCFKLIKAFGYIKIPRIVKRCVHCYSTASESRHHGKYLKDSMSKVYFLGIWNDFLKNCIWIHEEALARRVLYNLIAVSTVLESVCPTKRIKLGKKDYRIVHIYIWTFLTYPVLLYRLQISVWIKKTIKFWQGCDVFINSSSYLIWFRFL